MHTHTRDATGGGCWVLLSAQYLCRRPRQRAREPAPLCLPRASIVFIKSHTVDVFHSRHTLIQFSAQRTNTRTELSRLATRNAFCAGVRGASPRLAILGGVYYVNMTKRTPSPSSLRRSPPHKVALFLIHEMRKRNRC